MSGERILIVDDEPDAFELCQRILTVDGCEVESASDGWMAIERAKEKHFDLLLVDINRFGVSYC